MSIREANPDDFKAIQSLNYQIFDYEFEHSSKTMNKEYPFLLTGIEYFKKIVNQTDGNYGLVFEVDDVVVGYASLRLIDDNDLQHRVGVQQVQLQTLCVDERCRGQNIGHELVKASKAWAKKQGANNLKVVAMAKNLRTRKFYQDCGFEEFEIIHEIML